VVDIEFRKKGMCATYLFLEISSKNKYVAHMHKQKQHDNNTIRTGTTLLFWKKRQLHFVIHAGNYRVLIPFGVVINRINHVHLCAAFLASRFNVQQVEVGQRW